MVYTHYLVHARKGGEKKGIRNFQNEDGTWTEEGLRRRRELYALTKQTASTMSDKGVKLYRDVKSSSEKKKKEAQSVYDVSKQLSDEDLRKITARLNLEKNFRSAVTSDSRPSGKRSIEEWIGIAGGAITIAAAATTLAINVKKFINGE